MYDRWKNENTSEVHSDDVLPGYCHFKFASGQNELEFPCVKVGALNVLFKYNSSKNWKFEKLLFTFQISSPEGGITYKLRGSKKTSSQKSWQLLSVFIPKTSLHKEKKSKTH